MIPGFRFKLNPLMLFLFLLFFSVFSALSFWQGQRVIHKQQVLAEIQTANSSLPYPLLRLTDEQVLAHRYYRAGARGRFKSEDCLYVENVVFNGQPGLYLYCPFVIENDDRPLLVNMGWLKKPADRLNLPPISVSGETTDIEGVIQLPRSRPVVTAGVDKPNTELEKLWVYFDFEYLKKETGLDYYPIELQLSSAISPVLERDWPQYEAKIGMHIGYAIHWAAFALATLILFIKFNFKRTKYE
jgi:surfeit locus 1 family protein